MAVKVKKINLVLLFEIFSLVIVAIFFYYLNESFYLGSEKSAYIVHDSLYYYNISREITFEKILTLIFINKNIVGQIALFHYILNNSRLLWFIFVLLILSYSLFNLNKFLYINFSKKIILNLLILINPVIIVGFSGPNKEILGAIVSILFISYLLSKQRRFFYYSLFFSIFVRLEFTAVLIIVNFLKKNKYKWWLIVLIILIFNFIIFKSNYIGLFLNHAKTLGFSYVITQYAQNGFWFLVIPLKVIWNFCGDLFVLNIFKIEKYNLIIYLSEVLFFMSNIIIFYKTFKYKFITIKNSLFLYLIIYAIVFVLPPFIQHRYFIPLWPVLALLVIFDKRDIFYNLKGL